MASIIKKKTRKEFYRGEQRKENTKLVGHIKTQETEKDGRGHRGKKTSLWRVGIRRRKIRLKTNDEDQRLAKEAPISTGSNLSL